MYVEHKMEVGSMAVCLVDGSRDIYTVIFRFFRASRVVKVEDIRSALKKYIEMTLYQEELTQRLADEFLCEVETTRCHMGTETRIICQHVIQ